MCVCVYVCVCVCVCVCSGRKGIPYITVNFLYESIHLFHHRTCSTTGMKQIATRVRRDDQTNWLLGYTEFAHTLWYLHLERRTFAMLGSFLILLMLILYCMCPCVRTCIHTYIHTYTHTHTYIHARIYTYMVAEWLAWLTSNCRRIGAIGSSPSNG